MRSMMWNRILALDSFSATKIKNCFHMIKVTKVLWETHSQNMRSDRYDQGSWLSCLCGCSWAIRIYSGRCFPKNKWYINMKFLSRNLWVDSYRSRQFGLQELAVNVVSVTWKITEVSSEGFKNNILFTHPFSAALKNWLSWTPQSEIERKKKSENKISKSKLPGCLVFNTFAGDHNRKLSSRKPHWTISFPKSRRKQSWSWKILEGERVHLSIASES